MASHQFIYGGFTFGYSNLDWNSRLIYAEDQITLEATEYTINIKGLFSAATQAGFAALINNAKCILQTPGNNLSIQWSPDGAPGDWSPLFQINNTGGNADVSYGPKPDGLSVTRISGGLAAMFSWTVKCTVKECFAGGCSNLPTGSNAVQSWITRYSHVVDQNGLTTRNISGRLVVTHASVAAGNTADTFRGSVTPVLPGGFRRTSQSFEQSADGRTLTYSITDVEQQWMLPNPICSGNANWMAKCPMYGGMANVSLSGEFVGIASATKQDILTAIVALWNDRMKGVSGTITYGDTEIVEDVYGRNSLKFRLSARIPATSQFNGNGGTIPDPTAVVQINLGRTPPNGTGSAQPIGPYGGDGSNFSSGIEAGDPQPVNACSGSPSPPTNPPTPGTVIVPSSPNPKTPQDPVPPTPEPYFSTQQLTAMYEVFHELLSWEVDNQWKVFYPKAIQSKPVTQQVGNPKLFLIQSGYATRIVDTQANVPVPNPPYLTGNSVMRTASVIAENAEAMGNGSTYRAKVSWRYVMEFVGDSTTMNSTFSQMKYPVNPILSQTPFQVNPPNVNNIIQFPSS